MTAFIVRYQVSPKGTEKDEDQGGDWSARNPGGEAGTSEPRGDHGEAHRRRLRHYLPEAFIGQLADPTAGSSAGTAKRVEVKLTVANSKQEPETIIYFRCNKFTLYRSSGSCPSD